MDPRWTELQATGWDFSCHVYARTPSLHSPLMWAAVKAPHLIEWLLEAGADVHELEMAGRSAFHAAASWPNFDGMRILIEKGANPDFRRDPWPRIRTPLMDATCAKQLPVMSFLLDHNVNTGLTTYDDKTALMLAFELQYQEGVDLLLSKHVDIFQKDVHGRSILLYAAMYIPQMIPMLLDRGFEMDECDKAGRGMLYYGHADLIHRILGEYQQKKLNHALPHIDNPAVVQSNKPRL